MLTLASHYWSTHKVCDLLGRSGSKPGTWVTKYQAQNMAATDQKRLITNLYINRQNSFAISELTFEHSAQNTTTLSNTFLFLANIPNLIKPLIAYQTNNTNLSNTNNYSKDKKKWINVTSRRALNVSFVITVRMCHTNRNRSRTHWGERCGQLTVHLVAVVTAPWRRGSVGWEGSDGRRWILCSCCALLRKEMSRADPSEVDGQGTPMMGGCFCPSKSTGWERGDVCLPGSLTTGMRSGKPASSHQQNLDRIWKRATEGQR